jgi:hypothetical protein
LRPAQNSQGELDEKAIQSLFHPTHLENFELASSMSAQENVIEHQQHRNNQKNVDKPFRPTREQANQPDNNKNRNC